jgi:hypothetical protein
MTRNNQRWVLTKCQAGQHARPLDLILEGLRRSRSFASHRKGSQPLPSRHPPGWQTPSEPATVLPDRHLPTTPTGPKGVRIVRESLNGASSQRTHDLLCQFWAYTLDSLHFIELSRSQTLHRSEVSEQLLSSRGSHAFDVLQGRV